MSEQGITEEKKGKAWVKLVIVAAILVVAFVVANQFGLFDMFKEGTLRDQVVRLDEFFTGLGIWAPVVFILIWIVGCVFLLPGLPISIAGGLIFGAVWGSVWTTIGANLGAALAFLIGRYAARDMVAGWVEKNNALKKIDEGVLNQGWRMLMITRLVPLFPFNIQNYVYGLTDIKFSTYLLVTLPSMIPATRRRVGAGGRASGRAARGGEEDHHLPGHCRRLLRPLVPHPGLGEKAGLWGRRARRRGRRVRSPA